MTTVKEIMTLMETPTQEDVALVEKAYAAAAEAHKAHKRYSGEPYLIHLVETAKDLARLGMGSKTIAAGLLHDSVEDAGVSLEKIKNDFGKEVAFLVDGVTKIGQLKYHGVERHRESLRKLLVATGKDARVLIIKLMDRLHNMRTLQFVPPEKRQRIALETLEIYAAIAHRLGMGAVRRELEDLAFMWAYPNEYAEAQKMLTVRTKEKEELLNKMLRALKRELAENGITEFSTDFRVKGLWSLTQKLKRKDGDLSKIHDIAAIRVVVPTVADCYRVLGLVHKLWQPLPNKIKDYIAFPKPNGYQSLHTSVFSGEGGKIVEVQIRTKEMHAEAQYGIAAHVQYKEAEESQEQSENSNKQSSFDWIKSLIPSFHRSGTKETFELEPKKKRSSGRTRYGAPSAPEWLCSIEDELDDPDIDTAFKTDIFSHRAFVFTPTGDVVDLPIASCPIDFAYAIHSNIGDHVFAAKVNGKLVSLNTKLRNGDIVEIITKKSASPTSKWLDFAKTTMARRHIRNALEKHAIR